MVIQPGSRSPWKTAIAHVHGAVVRSHPVPLLLLPPLLPLLLVPPPVVLLPPMAAGSPPLRSWSFRYRRYCQAMRSCTSLAPPFAPSSPCAAVTSQHV